VGALTGATGGLATIATAVRSFQVSTVTAVGQVLIGGTQKKLRTETSQ
jgi:hypothetical protein